jgi:hypothetical protein
MEVILYLLAVLLFREHSESMVAIIITLILVGIILIAFAWLMFWPWVVEVDTSRNTYQLYHLGTVRFWLTSGFQPHLRILGMSVPLKPGEKKQVPKQSAKPKSKRQYPRQYVFDLWKGIVHSLRVNWFYLDLDTDDVVLNAQLIPVFLWMSQGPIHLATNFEGRVYAQFRAELKLYRMSWAFLLFFIKNKKYGNEF